MNYIENIENAIKTHRNRLTQHEVYGLLSDIDDVKTFMETHVYAVWDFMSLLKALQNQLTCVSIPWKPKTNPRVARFINEIVLGEESDLNVFGLPQSHFEMYLEAMEEVNGDTQKILSFIAEFDGLANLEEILEQADLKKEEKDFLNFTFKIIQSNEAHKVAAAFTFGREDVIPDMFLKIIEESDKESKKNYPKLIYYLERHIELDGDEHGPLAMEMIHELCGEDEKKWQEVLEVSQAALEHRIRLWDAVVTNIESKKVLL